MFKLEVFISPLRWSEWSFFKYTLAFSSWRRYFGHARVQLFGGCWKSPSEISTSAETTPAKYYRLYHKLGSKTQITRQCTFEAENLMFGTLVFESARDMQRNISLGEWCLVCWKCPLSEGSKAFKRRILKGDIKFRISYVINPKFNQIVHLDATKNATNQ